MLKTYDNGLRWLRTPRRKMKFISKPYEFEEPICLLCRDTLSTRSRIQIFLKQTGIFLFP